MKHMCLLQLHTDWLAEVKRAEQGPLSKPAKNAVQKRADLVADMVDVLKRFDLL